jgi:hypothetical protein
LTATVTGSSTVTETGELAYLVQSADQRINHDCLMPQWLIASLSVGSACGKGIRIAKGLKKSSARPVSPAGLHHYNTTAITGSRSERSPVSQEGVDKIKIVSHEVV